MDTGGNRSGLHDLQQSVLWIANGGDSGLSASAHGAILAPRKRRQMSNSVTSQTSAVQPNDWLTLTGRQAPRPGIRALKLTQARSRRKRSASHGLG